MALIINSKYIYWTHDSKLFQGLQQLDREYRIALKQDAKPFAIHVPRPVAFPLHAKA